MRVSADVVIIGGGITGCATAYYLAKRRVRVLVVEKRTVGAEQSGRAWGFIRQQGRHLAEMPLMMVSSRLWGELAGELEADFEFVRGGNLAIAETPEDLARLEEGYRYSKAAGLDSKLLTGDAVSALIPDMLGEWAGGLYTATDGHAEPLKATLAFRDGAQKLGAEFWEHCTAFDFQTTNGAISGVETDRGAIATLNVVCASGIWTGLLVEKVGLSVPLQIIRSSVAETHAAPPVTRLGVWGPRVAFRQRSTGEFYLGNGYRGAGADYEITLGSLKHLRLFLPSYRENWRLLRVHLGRDLLTDLRQHFGCQPRDRFSRGPWLEARVNRRKVRHNVKQFYRLFPKLGSLGLARVWAGFIDLTPDLIPVLGPLDQPQGIYIAAGFSGHGFGLAPVIGLILSQLLVDGKTLLDISAFHYSRFAAGSVARARKVL